MRYFHNRFAASWLAAVSITLLGCSLSRPAQAAPVLIGVEGLPGIDVAQRDSAGALALYDAEDDNADGIFDLAADLDVDGAEICVHVKMGDNKSSTVCTDLILSTPTSSLEIPFILTGTADRVVTRWNTPPSAPLALGQPFSVVDGHFAGLDAVVYSSLGFESAAEVIDVDLTTLPTYTGPALVGALLTFQIVPEPSTLALAVFGVLGLLIAARRKR